MKYIKLIILAAFLSTMFTGCSYVSDMVEGRITDRASFSATAVYNGTNVDLSWDKTDTGENFAGIEIYITTSPNDEYTSYTRIARRYSDSALEFGTTTTFTVPKPTPAGVYFYRIGIIHWDESPADRTNAEGYFPKYPDAGWDNEAPNYNEHTEIDSISGYAKVVIP